MPVTSVTIEGVPVPRSGSAKPRRLVRGRRLSTLVAAMQHLGSLNNQDQREARKAATRRYSPFLILGEAGSRVNNAYKTLTAALLAAKNRTA